MVSVMDVTSHASSSESARDEPSIDAKHVFVCHYRTCKRDGAGAVLAALLAEDLPHVAIAACGCLGLCGSGPIVLVAEDNTYYWRVRPQAAHLIAEMHLRQGQPVRSLLHPRLHPPGSI